MGTRRVVNVLLRQDDRVLLLKRTGTEAWVGSYTSPGGGVDEGETYHQAAVREVREEIGVEVNPDDLVFAGLFDKAWRKDKTVQVSYVFFTAHTWQGEPYNAEPHKHADPEWFSLSQLPETISPLEKMVIERDFQPDLVVM
ncbi:MAG: NUDIX domain-containing protein [Pseudomonadaceae bacterium]|nr:NUDIX domain-containing protein [Pseudomonadaceae bacterium]